LERGHGDLSRQYQCEPTDCVVTGTGKDLVVGNLLYDTDTATQDLCVLDLHDWWINQRPIISEQQLMVSMLF